MSIAASLMRHNVHNALFKVKSKRTENPCFLHDMDFDDRPEPAKRLEIARKKRGFKTARDAAKYFGWSYDTYTQHENGTRGIGRAAPKYATAFRVSEGWLLTGEGEAESNIIPIMGFVGAGAEVEPDFEQVPAEGLEDVEIPFPLPGDMIAFKVKGDSMLPQFADGYVIVCWREQRRSTESFWGEQAVVRTEDGRRFVKTIERAPKGVTLRSWNASPIENVHLAWIGEIFTYLPSAALRRTAKQGGIQGQLKLGARVA